MLALRLSPGHTDAVTGPCQGGAGSKTCPETKCHLLLPYGPPCSPDPPQSDPEVESQTPWSGNRWPEKLEDHVQFIIICKPAGGGGGISLITH